MRLNTISSELAEKIMVAQPQQQRAAALVACRISMAQTSMTLTVATETLKALEANEQISEQTRATLRNLTDELDLRYFELMDGEATDFAAETTARQFFSQARAIASLAYASEGNFPMSVVEAVYEAALSTDDPHRVIDAVDAALL